MIKDHIRYVTFPLMAFFLGLYPSIGAAQIPFDQTVGDWEISPVSFDDKSAVFCFASSQLQKDVSALIIMQGNYELEISIADKREMLPDGQVVPVSASIGTMPIAEQAITREPASLVLDVLPKYRKLLPSFLQLGSVLTVRVGDKKYEALLSNPRLVYALTNCVAEFVPAQPNTAKTYGRKGGAYREELTALFNDISRPILADDYGVLPEDAEGLPKGDDTVYWISGDGRLFGHVTLMDLQEDIVTAGNVEAGIYKQNCQDRQGEFVAQVTQTPESLFDRYLRFTMSCSKIGNGTTLFVTVIRRKEGGYYVWRHSGVKEQGEPDNESASVFADLLDPWLIRFVR